MFSDDAYNKNIHKDAPDGGPGTLIGNWAEERVLRDATGEGRNVPQRHIPRSGLLEDFTKTPAIHRKADDTFNRVYGPKDAKEPEPASRTIGAPDRHAGKIVKTGPRENLMATGRIDAAEAEVQAEEEEVAQLANVRHFETSTGVAHCKPDEVQAEKATFGRKSFKREILHGPTADRTLTLNNEGMDVPTHVHYSNAETVTHARMALDHPRMRSDVNHSAMTGYSAFGRNSAFTKPTGHASMAAKDEELEKMFHSLKSTQPLRSIGGHQPRGVFAEVPSLATLKTFVHAKIAEAWGAYGYVRLRQRLFDVANHEGYVHKADVVTIFRDELAMSPEEVPDEYLDTYLTQHATMKKAELKIGNFMTSLRPILPQKQKRRVLEAFRALNPNGGEIRLGDWLSTLQDEDLRATVVAAFGAQEEEQVAGTGVNEQVFMELFADLAPFIEVDALLAPC